VTHKKASYNPGLNPIKGHKFCPGTQTRSRDKLSSLPLGITKTSPLGPVLVDQPVTKPLDDDDSDDDNYNSGNWPSYRS
jgi:hypothetical protein